MTKNTLMTKKKFPRQKRHLFKYSPVLLVLFLFLSPFYTYAYLEPGTLSYVLQVLLAFFVGALVTMRIFWSNIKTFMNKLFKKEEKKEDKETDST